MSVVNIGDAAKERFSEHIAKKRRVLVNEAGGFTPTNEIAVTLSAYLDWCDRKGMWANTPVPLEGKWIRESGRYTLYTTYEANQFGNVNHPVLRTGEIVKGKFFMIIGCGPIPPDLSAVVWEVENPTEAVVDTFTYECGDTEGTLCDVSVIPVGLIEILHTTGWTMLEPAQFIQGDKTMVHIGFIRNHEYYFMVVDIKTANDDCNAWIKRAEEHRAQMKVIEEGKACEAK
jgi:hypothetical protein